MILNETIGNYSQTIKIYGMGYNEVEVKKNGEILFDGPATHIVDNGNKLSFKDEEGNPYEFIKYSYVTSTCA